MMDANEIKKELDNWKTELYFNLEKDTNKKEELFLISEYWLDNYEKYITRSIEEKGDDMEDLLEMINHNNILLEIFSETDIKNEKLPKVFPLSKNCKKIMTLDGINAISSIGYYDNHLLLLQILHQIYCFFFLDNKSRIRQGYLTIKNIKKEDNLIKDLKTQGVFKFMKKKEDECNDGILEVNKSDYRIYILDVLKPKKDNNNEESIRNRRRANTGFLNMKGNFGDKLQFTFGKRAYKIDKTIKLDVHEKMGSIKDCFKKIISIFKITKDIIKKTDKNDKKQINTGKINLEINVEKIGDNNVLSKHKRIKTEVNREVKSTKEFFPPIEPKEEKLSKKYLAKPNKPNEPKLAPTTEIKKNIIRSSPGLIGLGNIGATCYMNATLQCFSNVRRLRNYLFDNYKNVKNKKISFALVNVLENLWYNRNIQYFEPYYFKDVISDMNPLFKGIAANDPKDLILFLLETMHKELNIAPKKKIPNNYTANNQIFVQVFNEFINNFMNENRSIICEEFYGCTNSMTTCWNCKCTVHNVQAINILFFPLEEVRKFMNYQNNYVRIEDCFKYYEKQEIYPSFYCNNCRQIVPDHNQSKLIYTPPTLIVNLNRGRGIQYNVNIVFDEYLNIQNYIYANNGYYFYELIGVICHFGTNDMGGHFIAFCKNSDNCEWYEFNDSLVYKRDFNYVKSHYLPYVLFYSYIRL